MKDENVPQRVTIRESLKMAAYGILCLCVGAYCGVKFSMFNGAKRKLNPTESNSSVSIRESDSIKSLQINSQTLPSPSRDGNFDLRSFALSQEPRIRTILLRELDSERDAKRNVAEASERLWTKMSSLGMSFTDFETALTNLVQIEKFHFLAGAATVDFDGQRQKYQQMLTNMLDDKGVLEYKRYDTSRNSLHYLDEMANAARSKGIAIDADTLNHIHETMIDSGAYLEMHGGAFGSPPSQLSGDAARQYINNRADGLEAASRDLMSRLNTRVAPEVIALLSDSINSQIARDRNSLRVIEESFRRKQVMDNIMNSKRRQP